MKRMRDGSYTIKPTYKVGEHDIVPDMLAKRALLHPDQVAVEQRTSVGSTRSLTTSELQRQVEYTACGLIGLGVQAGDAVAILAPTSYEWLLLDLALLSIGAITVPIYESDSSAQIEHILTDAHVTRVFTATTQQAELVHSVAPEYTVAVDSFDRGAQRMIARAATGITIENVEQRRATISSSDIATIIYTSGTTGKSKGVMLHHSNFIEQLYAHQIKYPFITNRDVSMCFLPLNHILEKAWSYLCLSMGCQVAVLSDPKRILEVLPMVRPSMMGNVPRFWEKVYIGVQDKINRSPKPLRYVLRHAIQVGDRYFFDFVNEGKKAPLFLKLLYKLYDKTLFAKVKKAIGLQRGRFFPTAGASVSPEILRFLRSINVPMCVGYGLSETTATVSSQPMVGFDLESIGTIMPALEVKIDPETSEILIKGPTVTTGYYNNPEANAEAFTEDGFFRTGDAGRMENGVLYFTERIKDLFKTANGKYIAPQMLEGLLTVDPLFEQVAIIADGYKFVSALIYPNWEVLRREAAERGVSRDLSEEELSKQHEVHRLVMAHVEAALSSVAQYEKVKKFHLMTTPFSLESGELTNTLKLRRKVVAEHYASEIAHMYEE